MADRTTDSSVKRTLSPRFTFACSEVLWPFAGACEPLSPSGVTDQRNGEAPLLSRARKALSPFQSFRGQAERASFARRSVFKSVVALVHATPPAYSLALGLPRLFALATRAEEYQAQERAERKKDERSLRANARDEGRFWKGWAARRKMFRERCACNRARPGVPKLSRG